MDSKKIAQTRAAEQKLRYYIVRMCMPDTIWPFEKLVDEYFVKLREWYPLANLGILGKELLEAYYFWQTELDESKIDKEHIFVWKGFYRFPKNSRRGAIYRDRQYSIPL